MMLKSLATLITVSLLSGLSSASATESGWAATEIYYVRHAETLGNLTHRHTYENDRTFSDEGVGQVAALTRKLENLRFDHILVSPKYRALNTVFPYLKKHGLTAEVWPELEECCWQKTRQLSAGKLRRGSRIRLEAAMQPYFIFPDQASRYRYNVDNYGQGMMQTFMAVDRIRQRFAGSGKTILIVGHYHSGARIIEILQGIEPEGRHKLSNAKIHHLRERPDGTFTLISSNQ